MAGVKVRLDARWSTPPGIWNDKNWPDPTTNSKGNFKSRSRKLSHCKKRRDLRIRVYNGKKWKEVGRIKRRTRKQANFGNIRIKRQTVLPGAAYIPHVRSLYQGRLKGEEGDGVYEGCGPIAVAQVLAYWQTQRGKTGLLRNYRDDAHPRNDIRRLYGVLKTARVYSPEPTDQAATGPLELIAGMKKLARKQGLRVKHVADIVPWKKRRDILKRQVSRRRPVIMLIKNIPACLFNKKMAGWHYVVAVGYDKKNVQLMTGWKDHPAAENTSPSLHIRKIQNESLGRANCTWKEIKRASPGLYWYQ